MTPDSTHPQSAIRNPKIDFHFGVDHRIHYACRVVRKARAADKTVLAYARDAGMLARFDAALWTFSALEFLPHVYADSPLAAATPIVLTLDAGNAPVRQVLLNLDDDVPPAFEAWFGRFERVIEIVSVDADDRSRARQRFRRYRECGFEPVAHEVKGE
ncbi:MAG: DNA polymerase III subunit chi [Burkholderiaceae bacterium]|nr:DNA polymerase III subunit chi [Burkholderiaceae bacterium]